MKIKYLCIAICILILMATIVSIGIVIETIEGEKKDRIENIDVGKVTNIVNNTTNEDNGHIEKTNEKKEITLDKIVKSFKNSEMVLKDKENGIDLEATLEDNCIRLRYKQSGSYLDELLYKLEGNILVTTFSSKGYIYKAPLNAALVNAIGLLHGYSEGELIYTAMSTEEIASRYTLEKDGYEITTKSNGEIKIKIDITKKMTKYEEIN